MKYLFLSTAIVIFLFSCNSSKNGAENQKNKIEFPTRVINKNVEGFGFPDTLNFEVNGINYSINPNGNLYLGSIKKDSLRLTTDMGITKAFYYLKDSILYLFCEETDMDTGTSEIFKINPSNKQLLWKARINGFNLGQPVVRGDYAYLTVIGLVGKLDLNEGKFVYESEDLYDREKYSFNSFDTIEFKDNLTIFVSKNYHSKKRDCVILNEDTKTLEIQK